MFCPKCGKKEVVDIFCASCLQEEKPLVSSFKDFFAIACISCGDVHHRNKWHETAEPHEKLAEFLKDHLVFPNYADIKKVEVEPLQFDLKSGLMTNGEAKVTVTGRASKKAVSYKEEYSFPFKVLASVCPRCSKKGTEYFEGTLQVRNETKESALFLKDWMKQTTANIAKEEKSGTGHDYYLSQKGVVERSARAIQERFGGRIVSSARLFSKNKKTSKDIYRVTWFVELPPFKAGDVVKLEKSVLVVMELGKKIRFHNPTRGKTEFHEYKEGSWEKMPVFETRVSSLRPELRVLHPENFDEVKVFNAEPGEHEIDELINVVVDGKRTYIIDKKTNIIDKKTNP